MNQSLPLLTPLRGILDVTSGVLAVGRGVSGFVLGLWLLPRVKAAKGLPMMQRDLPLLIAFVLPFALMQFAMTPQLTLLLIWISAAQGSARVRCCASWITASPTGWGISPTPSTCSMRWYCSLAAS